MNEWPLVTFTLFVQSSVGVTLFSALYFCWLEKEIGNQRATVAMRPVLLTAAIISINTTYGISMECFSCITPYFFIMVES
ncbi:DmsC/YnfH family molybdoenzyme membrane anchor subunit [Proteus penneri]|uniref:DmsC/YnfH family molybdoenzyme membrane anchor subunit n=1 Tax=Proteus penneri TaxID=102862 RepID=UPI0035D412ED